MKLPTFTVTSYRFDRGVSLPRRIEVDGISYQFKDPGLALHVASKHAQCVLLALSDGMKTFHLKADSRGASWELVKIV